MEKKKKTMGERKDAVKATIMRGLRLKKQYSTGDIDQKVSRLTLTGVIDGRCKKLQFTYVSQKETD